MPQVLQIKPEVKRIFRATLSNAFLRYTVLTNKKQNRAIFFSQIEWGLTTMTFVVGENCIKCKYTDCVEVCPVDCFYEGPNFLVIHPDECIDCALCEPECPANAIFAEDEVPKDQLEFIELNAALAGVWDNITEKKAPLPDASEWDGVKGKLDQLER